MIGGHLLSFQHRLSGEGVGMYKHCHTVGWGEVSLWCAVGEGKQTGLWASV